MILSSRKAFAREQKEPLLYYEIMSVPVRILLVFVGMFFCFAPFLRTHPPTPSKRTSQLTPGQWRQAFQDKKVSELRVDPSGVAYLDGKQLASEDTKRELGKIKEDAGAVHFIHQDPSARNAKQAAEILNTIAELRIPIKFSTGLMRQGQ